MKMPNLKPDLLENKVEIKCMNILEIVSLYNELLVHEGLAKIPPLVFKLNLKI